MTIKHNKSFDSLLSGSFAASGSLFGKLSGLEYFSGYLFTLRIIFFCLMLVFNSISLTMFTKALQKSDSSLSCTVSSAASNYVLSGLYGVFIFNEGTCLLWWFGIMQILSGLFLLSK